MRRTSATGESARQDAGFSLIELLVVLVLLSLAFGTVLLTMPAGEASLDREAERLSAAARHARDEAVMANRATALRIERTGFGFEQRRAGQWLMLDASPHARRAFPDGVVARWEGGADSIRVAYDALGATSPVEVWLESDGRRRHVVFATDRRGAGNAAR